MNTNTLISYTKLQNLKSTISNKLFVYFIILSYNNNYIKYFLQLNTKTILFSPTGFTEAVEKWVKIHNHNPEQ